MSNWSEYRDKRRDDWIAMTQAGSTLEECGRKYGVTRARVQQVLGQLGISVSEIRASRKTALASQPITCRRCGEPYLWKDRKDHFRAGSHRYMAGKRDTKTIVRDAEIAEDYETGLTYRQIMAKHGVAQPRVVRALRWNHIEPYRRPAQRSKSLEESYARWDAVIADWRTETMLNKEIADKHGISDSMIGLILRSRGLRTNRAESMRRRGRVMKWQRRHRRR